MPPIYLHVTLDGENAIDYRFWSHPFDWKLFWTLYAINILVDLSHQPKVWHFDLITTTNQDVTSCKVAMNEVFLREVILIRNVKDMYEIHLVNE